ncbi:MAG: 4Fe-4S dicluster domain-containing protein [Clostridia bacterium]|nr:4Fe-4S dicluster domain-containing protein [Clostridia bacterium]
METYWHSVTLDKDLCKGCTHCLKLCPTQAIRVQGGKAKILKERCIDCGECIRVCPYHAKKGVADSLSMLKNFKHNVALVAPAFYGQFSRTEDINVILSALLDLGFDDVFEVARGAQVISQKTKELLKSGELLKPAISSACPAVLRLIAIKFPNLIPNVVPLKSPMEISAEQARREATQKTGLSPEEIGIIFISPCAAKATFVKGNYTVKKSEVDGVIPIKDICIEMSRSVSKMAEENIQDLRKSGKSGVLWATSGGEAEATDAPKHIAVDEIHNIIKLFEDIEDGKMDDIDYVEALACPGGCVGGPLTAENSFSARSKIQRMCKEIEDNSLPFCDGINMYWDESIVYRPIMNLDNDINVAMQKMNKIEELYNEFPKLDCGSCGSPSCRALAEDIVRGYAKETDCIFKLREKVSALARDMLELESQNTLFSNKKTEEK